jgi:hypothetical protein
MLVAVGCCIAMSELTSRRSMEGLTIRLWYVSAPDHRTMSDPNIRSQHDPGDLPKAGPAVSLDGTAFHLPQLTA